MNARLLLRLGLITLAAVGCTGARLGAASAPRYPELLRSGGLAAGEVRARVHVARSGATTVRAVDATAGHELARAATLAWLRGAGARPARRVGIAVPADVAVAVRFVLLRPEGARPPLLRPSRLDSLPAACPDFAEATVVAACARAEWPRVVPVDG